MALQRAERLFGREVAPRAQRAVARFGAGWVSRALEAAGARGRTVVWGYVATCLERWGEEGGPPPAARPEQSREELLRLSAERIDALMARRANP